MEFNKETIIKILYSDDMSYKIKVLYLYCLENNKNMNLFQNFINIVVVNNILDILINYIIQKKIQENNINITILTDLKTNKILKIY